MNIHIFYKPILLFFRRRRMKVFSNVFAIDNNTRILDVGGTPFNWTLVEQSPLVTLVNLDADEDREEGNLTFRKGDGRRLEYPDNSYDIAYSNSVIEHVGDWGDMVAFAREVSRVAPRYYVQTPYRWFFVEPHLIAPFIHFLPLGAQRRLARNFTIWGLITRPNQAQVDLKLREQQLLTVEQMRRLFPDAEIHRERFLGMTKSLIALKS